MGIMIKPTKDRNGTYYIHKAVPQELRSAIGKGELKRSLETKDLEQAKLRILPHWLKSTRSSRTPEQNGL